MTVEVLMILLGFVTFESLWTIKITSLSAFQILGLVACYGLVLPFEGSSQIPLSFWLITENLV